MADGTDQSTRAATAFGIDIGGSGIKGAVVDTRTGELLTPRVRIATPQPSDPDAVAAVVADLVAKTDWHGLVGATFPAVIQHGVARTAANVDKKWIGTDADAAFSKATGLEVTVLNDADAAGIAEVRFGAAKDVKGMVILLTFGTGIGSALLLDGVLVPNTELGHVELDGHDAETRASAAAKDRHKMTYEKWAKRVQRYMSHIEALFTPDLFVVGGGVSKDSKKWLPLLDLHTPVVPAQLLNNAGIVGAALAAVADTTEQPASRIAG
ncbi:MAG: ROK family protein [Actinobacteria bacterium]|nr:ROK family protein [Actinomycetota bacterium]